jgi:hypothetical protein
VFLTTKTRYSEDFSYRLRAELITPSSEPFVKEVAESEIIVDSHATVTNRRLLFDLPPGIGDYELSLTLQEKNGDVALDEVTVLVKARP